MYASYRLGRFVHAGGLRKCVLTRNGGAQCGLFFTTWDHCLSCQQRSCGSRVHDGLRDALAQALKIEGATVDTERSGPSLDKYDPCTREWKQGRADIYVLWPGMGSADFVDVTVRSGQNLSLMALPGQAAAGGERDKGNR